MFIDEKTKIEIHANLNESVIHATLRPQDLIPAFIEVIKSTPEYVQLLMLNNYEIKSVLTDMYCEDEIFESEEILYFLNETLFDLLNNYAPDGYYFGAHEGNGSDFGYWEINE